MTPVWFCLALALVLWTGCSQERSTRQPAGSATAGRQAATGSTADLNEEQESAYLRGASAQIAERGGSSVSDKKEAMVHMTNEMRFAPAAVTITAGQSVVWMNTSSMVHTVTDDPSLAKDPGHAQLPPGARPFNSGEIAPAGTFRQTFDVPGTYVYFCIPHEPLGMIGRVIVQEKK